MGFFTREEDGNKLVGKLCRLTLPDGTERTAIPDIWDKKKGWSWGTRATWFPAAVEIIPCENPQEDGKESLLGTDCYVWDSFYSGDEGVIIRYEPGIFPYRTETSVWRHARPKSLGEPSRMSSLSSPSGLFDMQSAMVRPRRMKQPTEEHKPAVPTKPTATWEQVKGQDEAKQALKEAVELPRNFSALYAAYGKKASKGALLYGPPGCGKTMLGRTLAGTLGCGEDGFRYVKGGELFDKHVGAEEEKIRDIFAAAKAYKRRTGTPQIVFFDEADALFPHRRGMSSNSQAGYDFMASTIGAFLTELDGLEECGAFVILSTNRPEVMDPAVLRDGRIDRKVLVARPNREVAADILTAGLSKTPGFSDDMIETAVNAIYDAKLCYYVAETEDRGAVRVNFHHQISGALLDGIVERTINNALQRDIAANLSTPSGITKEDIFAAVDGSWRSTLGLDLQWLLEEVVGQQKINSIKTIHGRFLGIAKKDDLKIKIEHEMKSGDNLGEIE